MPITETPEIAWRTIGPAFTLAGGAVLTLLVGAFGRRPRRGVVMGLTLAAIAGASFLTFDLARADERLVGMQGMVAVDGVALWTNMILLFSATIVTLVSYGYLSARRIHRVEYYSLLLLATAGMVLLASSNDLIMVFISLEVLSLALYVMTGIARRDAGSQEASLKYFLLGAFSSAFLLYGLALAYGATGQTNISAIAKVAASEPIDARLIFTAAAMIAVGFAFKVAAVPFHMWTPDVYQGAPTSVTAFMAAGTKAAGFAALLRTFLVAFGTLQFDWRPAFWLIAILTMSIGSLIAVVQTDVKRLLAYSSIAHAGFVLVGVVAASGEGVAGSLFYLLVYAIMTLGAFAAVIASAPDGRERLDIASWVGLGQRHPLFAGAMTLFLLSLAGLPPTAGFMGKFFVFKAAVDAGETGLVVAGVLASVVASFFYLRLIVAMWLQDPSGEPGTIGLTTPTTVALAITAVATLAIGVYPQGLMDLARTAAIFTG
jgi:NADH-quinone oxidoreductase subunit N